MTTIAHEGKTFTKVEDPPRGKKAHQVALIIQKLQEAEGEPLEFEQLCLDVDLKYPQDVVAAALALEFVEHVDRYHLSSEVGHRAKSYYVWTGPANPTSASSDS